MMPITCSQSICSFLFVFSLIGNDAVKIPTKMAGTNMPESYMIDHCHGGENRKTFVNKSLKISLLRDIGNEEEIDCTVTYGARRQSQRLMVSFENIAIQDDVNTDQSLRIYDGDNDQVILTKDLKGMYKRTNSTQTALKSAAKIFQSTSSSLTFKYVGIPTAIYKGFTAVLTVFEEPPFKNGSCGSEYFQCRSKMCIAEELHCNGYINCADYTDEDSCVRLPDHTGFYQPLDGDIGMLVGGSISILILMIVAVWLGIVCIRKIITKREFDRTQQMMISGPVIDADHIPPVIRCPTTNRHQLPPIAQVGDPPPLYIEHSDNGRLLIPPPPYTPDGCDTAVLLNQTQSLSFDTPPAYQTIDPFLDRNLNSHYAYMFPNSTTLDGDGHIDGSVAPVHSVGRNNRGLSLREVEVNNPHVTENNEEVGDRENCTSAVNNLQMVNVSCQVGDSLNIDNNNVVNNDQNCQTTLLAVSDVEPLDSTNLAQSSLEVAHKEAGNNQREMSGSCLLSDSIADEAPACQIPIEPISNTLCNDSIDNMAASENAVPGLENNNNVLDCMARSGLTENNNANTSVTYFKRPKTAKKVNMK